MAKLTDSVVELFKSILSIFPDSPIQTALAALDGSDFSTWLGWLNWFVPVGTMLGILEAWCMGILIYYAVQIILRWIKAIE